MNWFKQTLANVAGTQEPEYGPSAIQSVAIQAQDTPYTEVTRNDLKWKAMESTNVETQCFYLMSDTGVMGMVQLIYNNVGGIRTTCQFNTKIYDHGGKKDHLWCSDPLDNYGFDEDQVSFFADNVAISLNEDATAYTIKSAVNENSIVNLEVTRTSPGFQAGKNGTSYYGTDPQNPWGTMRHLFWPRCKVEGKIITKAKEYDFKGRGLFIHALQGMKPHHAAAKWNFVNLQTPTYSACMNQFTTPQSYGTTSVNVGGLAKDGEIICAGPCTTVTHTETNRDDDNDWPEPKAVKWEWTGKTKDGKEVVAEVTGSLGERLDRVDVLSHIPGVIKTIVGGVVGTKPYIYQYGGKMTLKLKIGDSEAVEEEGTMFSEATFIL